MSSEIDVLPTDKQVLSLEVKSAPALPAIKRRGSPVSHRVHDELIHLVQRLFLNGPQSPQAVVFCATERGNGCTFVCTRIAAILASQLEEPVCLVDANFRSPGLERQFAPSGEGKASNVWLLSYRPEAIHSSRLAGLDRFKAFIEDLRKEFTYILIDAPPLDETSDATAFARAADGLVLVLQAHTTRREAAQRAKEALDASGVSILGAVLNKRTYPIPESVYRRL